MSVEFNIEGLDEVQEKIKRLSNPRLMKNAARRSSGTQFGTILRGTVTTGNYITNPAYAAPYSAVLSTKLNISGVIRQALRVNSVVAGSTSVSPGTGGLSNNPLYIGRRAGTTLPFNGHIYGLIGIGKLVSDSETAAIEKELAKRVGVTLSV